MKRILHLSVILFLLSAASGFAQTQKGYVKTKGRMDANGNIIAGKRLSGVTIQPSERQAVVSRSDGTFSFPVPHSLFSIQGVYKEGFVIADPDILSRQYSYSTNPFVLVLEVPEEQLEDMLLAQRRIRRTLARQLQEKEDELDSLRALQRITEEDYRQAVQALYAQQDINKDLISDMAERYSKLDFDGMDEFNQQICWLILDGKLTEADSLINAKGSINTRISTLQEHQDAIAKEEQLLRTRQSRLEKSKAMARAELEDLARDCYSKFDICKLKHQFDSASYYLELRALLDTTRIEWLCDFAEFSHDYIGDYENALKYFTKALREAKRIESDIDLVICLSNLGMVYDTIQDTKNADECHSKAISSLIELHQDKDVRYASVFINAGLFYLEISDYDKAELYIRQAQELFQSDEKCYPRELAASYNSLAIIKSEREEVEEALQLLLTAKELFEKYNLINTKNYASCLNSLGIQYDDQNDLVRALDCYSQALQIDSALFGKNHLYISTILSNRGIVYRKLGDNDKALADYMEAIAIKSKLLGDDNPDLAVNYNNLGSFYRQLGNYGMALSLYKKALDICLSAYGNKHVSICMITNSLGVTLTKMGDVESALNYYIMSLESTAAVFGENHRRMGLPLANMGALYLRIGDNATALEYYKRALSVLPDNDSMVPSIKEHIEDLTKAN